MSNPVVGWQIISSDPDASAGFLQELFGWKTRRDNALAYREIEAGFAGLPGGVWPAPEGVKPFVQLFIEVKDLDASIARAIALGARVLVPGTVLPEGNAMAVLADPLGMPFVMCTARDPRSSAPDDAT